MDLKPGNAYQESGIFSKVNPARTGPFLFFLALLLCFTVQACPAFSISGDVTLVNQVGETWWNGVRNFWNARIWLIEGNPVTVGKIILAVCILVFGGVMGHILSRRLREKLISVFDVGQGSAHGIERLLFYILLFVVFMTALKTVGIPLTAFAFLGGAFVIGIGFGAQNIFSNVISGFILIIQKPIRVNDTIQVEEMIATVKEIGARYTRVRTFDNVDVLIPNSHFLENRIINWTLSDSTIRTKVTVGVAYGSPAREVERLLLSCADNHPEVLKTPAPLVVFRDFGESSLVFDLYLWIDFKISTRYRVESDLRFMIIDLFDSNHISISFPQRDIHLDATTPIDIRLLRDEGSGDTRKS